MTTVNLLPWREQLREERRRVFLISLLGVVVVAAAVVLLEQRHWRASIHELKVRNDLLRRQVETVDISLDEIEKLQQRQRDIVERLLVFRQLQSTQSAQMKLFESVARAAPPDIQLDLLRRQDERLQIEGVARSNSAVADLMRGLDSELEFRPSLQRIEAVNALSGGEAEEVISSFLLTLDFASSPAEIVP